MTGSTELPQGDCFPAAFKHLAVIAMTDLDGKQYALVHGNLAHLPQNTEVNHAWVEEGDLVYEIGNSLNARMSKSEYYARFGVKNVRRYSLIEAMRNQARCDHYGPWIE